MNFESKRLVIRPLDKEDYTTWQRDMYSLLQPQNEFDEAPFDKDQINRVEFTKIIDANAKESARQFSFNYFAFSKDNGQIIGTCQLWSILRFNCQRATLGFSIFNTHWRKGYGLELAIATINHGINDLKLNRIEAEILPSNLASINLCKKAQMQSEGLRRQALYENNAWQDHEILAIVAEDLNKSSIE